MRMILIICLTPLAFMGAIYLANRKYTVAFDDVIEEEIAEANVEEAKNIIAGTKF